MRQSWKEGADTEREVDNGAGRVEKTVLSQTRGQSSLWRNRPRGQLAPKRRRGYQSEDGKVTTRLRGVRSLQVSRNGAGGAGQVAARAAPKAAQGSCAPTRR